MFNFATEEHGMIREAVQKVFAGLHVADTEKRQREGARVGGDTIAQSLAELGLFDVAAGSESMASAQVQSIAALEAGAVALPFPVTEWLAAHASVMQAKGFHEKPDAMRTVSAASNALDAVPIWQGGRVQGTSRLVSFSQAADRALIVVNRAGGLALADVDLKNASVVRRSRTSVEADYLVDDLTFDSTPAAIVDEANGDGAAGASQLRQRLALLAAAEMAGACRQMVSMTREYLLVRTQFGKPLGANQALKHKLAENHVRVEALIAAVDYAAAASDAQADDAEEAIFAAKLFAARAGKAVADSSLQMHGAIGYTVEFPLHLLMKRVFRLGVSFGGRDVLSDRLFALFKQ